MFINTLKSYFPAEIINNQYFVDRMDTTDEWIVSRVGIKERRICREKNPTAFMGVQAVNQIPHDQLEGVDCIISAASVVQYQAPATANFIAKELGIDGVPCFDVRAACSSFIYGCTVVNGLLATGFKKILFVLSEPLTTTADYNDRATSILFGDGAVAAIISNQPAGFEMVGSLIDSKSSGADSVIIPNKGYFFQEGNKVQNFAVRYSIKASQDLLAKLFLGGPVKQQVDYLILHQANLVMMKSVTDNLGLDRSQLLQNIEYFGNTGSVGAPSVLAENWDKITGGQRVLMTVVGAGLSWGSMLLKKYPS